MSDHPSAQAILDDLASADAALRLSAIRLILTRPTFEEGEVPRLVKALHAPLRDQSVEVRYYARKAFSRLHGLLKGAGRGLILPELLDADLQTAGSPAPTYVYGTREYWLYELNSVDYKLRVKAIIELSRQPTRAGYDRIVERLAAETHEHVLATIVKYLPAFRQSDSVARIVTFLGHPDSRVRANAIEGLERLGDPAAVEHVLPFLTDADNRVRANATKLLIGSHPDEVRRTIGEMLDSPHEWMRDSALYILSHLEVALVEDVVLKAMGDASPEIVAKAITLLGAGASSERALLAIEAFANSQHAIVRQAAGRALQAVRARAAGRTATGPPGRGGAAGSGGRS